MKHRLLVAVSLTALVVVSSIGSFFSPVNAQANSTPISESQINNASFRFINRAAIEATIGSAKLLFFDENIGDDTYSYKVQANSCENSHVTLPKNNDGSPALDKVFLTLHYIPASSVQTDCSDRYASTDSNKTFSITGNGDPVYILDPSDPTRIFRADNNSGWEFKQSSQDKNIYLKTSESSCQDRIVVNLSNNTYYLFQLDGDGDKNIPSYAQQAKIPSDCGIVRKSGDNTGFLAYNEAHKLGVDSSSLTPGSISGSAGSGQDADSCESKGGPLGWIMCPVINALDGFLNWVDSRIQELLSIDETKYRDESLEQTWRAIRNIAYLILVPIVLIMVIGTALGFELVSAYTVKRALPRLIAAVLFIALSWEITGFLIQLSNDVGRGVLGLITAPLDISGGSDGVTLQDLFSPSYGGTVVQAAGAAAGVGALMLASAAGIEVLGIAWGFLQIAALILLTAFIVLIARQLLILAFMIFAPLAILAWIFPGNDKLWKFWWGTFSKMLIMFPMITALIGMGRVFAYIVGNADSSGAEGAILNPLLKLVAYVIPYLFIPFTFKFAGGVIGNLTGMINDRERGLLDRMKKGRQERYGRAGQKVLQKRADVSRNMLERGSQQSRSVLGRGLQRFGARTVGGRNIEALMAASTNAGAKEVEDITNNGPDDAVRGLTAAASFDAAQRNWKQAEDDKLARVEDGVRQYRSLGGAWINEADVLAGRRRWGHDRAVQQAAVSYEMRKAMTNDQVEGISNNYTALANSLGMSDNEAGGAWIGAAFANQNQHIEYKNTDFEYENGKIKGPGKLNAKKFATEIFEKKGSYPLAQMSAHTVKQLKAAYNTNDPDIQDKVRSIAETFVVRGGGSIQGIADGEVPVTAPPGVSREPIVSASGAAHVNDAVQDLYRHVNPGGTQQTPTQGPPPDWREPGGYR